MIGDGSRLRMSASEVMKAATKFLKDEVGFDMVSVSSVVAIEPDSKWKVVATVEGTAVNKKEVLVDDKDGNIISYRDV